MSLCREVIIMCDECDRYTKFIVREEANLSDTLQEYGWSVVWMKAPDSFQKHFCPTHTGERALAARTAT